MKKFFQLILFLAVMIPPALAAADPSVRARVSANQTTLEQPITLSIEAMGIPNLGAPPSFEIPNFTVQRAGQMSSYQFVNGQTSSMVTFNFLLYPLKTGELTIPGIALNHDGKTYSSDPITVTVSDGGAGSSVQQSAPQAGGAIPSEGMKPLFMTASVDKSKAFVGEQILLKVQFLRRPNVQLASQPRYFEPDMTGFVVEPMKQQEYSTTIQGTPYVVNELRYAIFPTTDGEFAIGNARIEVAVRTPWDPFDPNNFFQGFFSQAQAAKLDTRAVPVQIRALPKTKPTGFLGSVGRYKITARVDSAGKEAEVGKPLNLIVKIEGTGNIKAIKEPAIPELKAFKKYETISTSKINDEGAQVQGHKEFRILLIPQVSGRITIPSIEFPYFNPKEAEYITDRTAEIPLDVKPGTLTSEPRDPTAASAQSPGVESQGIRIVEKDIRFIKIGKVGLAHPPIYFQPWFYFAAGIPMLLALSAGLAAWQSRRKSANWSHYRARGALRSNLKEIRDAEKSLLKKGDISGVFNSVQSALTGFFADKFDVSAVGLTWEDINRRLQENEIPEELRNEVRSLLDQADMARFATTSFTVDEAKNAATLAKTVLLQLEEKL